MLGTTGDAAIGICIVAGNGISTNSSDDSISLAGSIRIIGGGLLSSSMASNEFVVNSPKNVSRKISQ